MTTSPGFWRRVLLTALALAAVVSGALAGTPGATCPPVTREPSAEQVQAAVASARDRGFLWRVTRDGRSSYLFGTVHLGKLGWVFPGPALRRALAEIDTLALELDSTDPATLRDIQAAMRGASAPLALSPELGARLERQVAAACLPPGSLDNQHPVMRVITLTVLSARWEGLDPGYAQETMLAGTARARQVPIVSLETAATQVAAIIPPDAMQAHELVSATLTQLESGAARRVAARMAQAWADRRLDDLQDYERWCECVATERDRSFMRRVNDERNPAMAERIEALHAGGRQVLAAVGALHMTGTQALPTLLRQRGFVVERVIFDP